MKKEFKNAIYEYKNEELIEELNKYIDENIDEIYNFFGNDIKKEKPTIHIISKQELDKIYKEKNETAPKWLVGFSRDNDIYYIDINELENTIHKFKTKEEQKEFYKKTILHEYVHFVNRLFNKKYNIQMTTRCLVEGIAQILSKQNEFKNIKFEYSLEDILKSTNCYNGWFLTTQYIIENYSKEEQIELFKNKSKAENFIIETYDDIKKYYKKLTKTK